MDLLSAAGFVVAWLLRDRLEPETVAALLLWPVLFEAMLWIALTVAAGGARIQKTVARNLWFGVAAAIYLAVAWMGVSGAGRPWLWFAALWLLLARTSAPAGMRWLGPQHREWFFSDAFPASVMIWVPAFLLYVVLLGVAPGDCQVDEAGENVCRLPPWVYVLVWGGYFVLEGITRARSIVRLREQTRT